MTNYPTKKISECIDKLSKKSGVPRNRYQKEGHFPIIDQGQDFVGGFTNDKFLVYTECLPVIVFGDHTRAIKFVDFPFVVGADGTKVLKPKDFLDAKYFYLALKSLDIESRGYARHFRILKDKEIPLPPLSGQKKIVAKLERVLAKINEAKKLRIVARKNADNLLSTELHKIFEEGEKKGWEEKELEGLIDTITPPEKIQKKDFKQIGKYPVIDQSQDEIAGWTDDPASLVNIKKPVVIFGDHTCAVKYSEKPFAQGADGIKILSANQDLLPRFLFIVLKNNPIESEGYRRHFSKLKQYKIPLPPLAEQKKIVARLDSLSEKVGKIKNLQSATQNNFTALEQSILSKAFSKEAATR